MNALARPSFACLRASFALGLTCCWALAGCAANEALGLVIPGSAHGAAFMASVRDQCGETRIGDNSLGTLLAEEPRVRELTEALYRGNLSNDQYRDALVALYPAADGNAPAVGCVIDRLNACLHSNCAGQRRPSRVEHSAE